MQTDPTRILIATVGQHNLRDLSFGPLIHDRLCALHWPSGVDIEDFSYGPIGIMHALDERPRYERMIFVGASAGGRKPASIHRYRWNRQLPPDEEVHARVTEGATGVITLENLLIILDYFGKLSSDVIVVELEPVEDSWGESLSAAAEAAAPQVIDALREEVSRMAT